jgi:hypothetical protein
MASRRVRPVMRRLDRLPTSNNFRSCERDGGGLAQKPV